MRCKICGHEEDEHYLACPAPYSSEVSCFDPESAHEEALRKTDVFIRTMSKQSGLRHAMAAITRERWLLEDCRVQECDDATVNEFRADCECMAQTDPYIISDDDVLIVGKDWVKRAAALMLANPHFAIVSTLSLVEGENLAVPGYISGKPEEQQMDIYPMHAVGQPMLIRKGICVDLPPMDLNNECGTLHKFVLDKGYEMGLIHPKHHIRHNHMGHAFSSNPSLFWGY